MMETAQTTAEAKSRLFLSWNNLAPGQRQIANRGFRGVKGLRFKGRAGSRARVEVHIRAVERRPNRPDRVLVDSRRGYSGSGSASFRIVPSEPNGGYSVRIVIANESSRDAASGDAFHD